MNAPTRASTIDPLLHPRDVGKISERFAVLARQGATFRRRAPVRENRTGGAVRTVTVLRNRINSYDYPLTNTYEYENKFRLGRINDEPDFYLLATLS